MLSTNEKPLVYLGGDIMSFGSNLARQYEYDKFIEAGIPVDVYSPVMNKSINDKSNMTEEQNNVLAEKITDADIERLWNSDSVVISPEQNAIGTLCELGCLYGWKFLFNKINDAIVEVLDLDSDAKDFTIRTVEEAIPIIEVFVSVFNKLSQKNIFAHYFDIRNNHLNEKDWRRSFSINQLLYGMILYCTHDHKLHESFDEILPILQEKYCKSENAEEVADGEQ